MESKIMYYTVMWNVNESVSQVGVCTSTTRRGIQQAKGSILYWQDYLRGFDTYLMQSIPKLMVKY